ncbi:MAG: hypothetical protein HRF47_05860 [Chloroflexota bacterium]|jgi:hypothetical protein
MKLIRFFIPRIEYVLFMALFWSVIVSGPKILNFDGDLPRHLLMGRLILQTRSVSTVDVFSFRTTGFPSIPHEWLAQTALAGAHKWLGLDGVVLLTAALITAVWILVFREAYSRSRSLLISLFLVALAAGAAQIHVLPRPHLFTYLLTAIWVGFLEQIQKESPRKWWLLPLTMLIWVNLHGMFVLGILLWGIYLSGSFLEHPSKTWFTETKTKAMALAGGFSLLATFFSPSGIHIWETIISLGSNSYITSKITEYQSANFHLPETWLFLALLLLVMAGFARAGQIGWTPLLLTVTFTFLALYTSRMIPLFAVVIPPVAAKALADWARQDYPDSRFARFEERLTLTNESANGWIWLAFVVLGTTLLLQRGVSLDTKNKGNAFDSRFFPVQAVDWLEAHPQNGHVFNEFDWGGYLLLRLYPPQQIFMDGHTHIYGEALTREYETVMSLGEGWEDILEKYQIEWAIVRAQTPIAQKLEKSGWEILYRDETAVILRKP